jgi:hypothetical protein
MCSSMTVYTVLTRQGHYTQYVLNYDSIHSIDSSRTLYTVCARQGQYTQYLYDIYLYGVSIITLNLMYNFCSVITVL